MPDIPLGNHVFDLEFHPKTDHVYAGLLTGEIKAFAYQYDDGTCQPTFSLRPTKRSCRGLACDLSGDRIWSVSKDKAIHIIDTIRGDIIEARTAVHDSALSRVKQLLPNMFATGDDDGVIKLWDSRKSEQICEYTQHFDYISDFLWLEDKRQLISTSGDGTLSVIDVRSKKPEPFAHSEDQEDELLSIAPIKGNTKFVVGTQLGILSIFSRTKGWGDCVDRIPGHPSSIDALCALTSDVILTGSSDGLIRTVQIFPTKFLGVIADHGDFPIERLKLDRHNKWLGSASHDEAMKLTDVGDALEESDDEREKDDDTENDAKRGNDNEDETVGLQGALHPTEKGRTGVSDDGLDEPDSDDEPKEKKKRRKKNKRETGSCKKGGTGDSSRAFFSDL